MVTNSTVLVVGGWCKVECVLIIVLVLSIMYMAQKAECSFPFAVYQPSHANIKKKTCSVSVPNTIN